MRDVVTVRGASRRHWLAGLILLAAAIDFVDLARAAWPFVTDDMYISLRYARSWVDGHGLAWNPGEGVTVEGYSNFSFVALAAAAMRLGIDPVITLRLVGAVSILAACPLLYAQARRVTGPLLATVPGVLLLAFPGTAWWGVSGLETGFYLLVAVASVSAFVRGLEGRAPGWLLFAGMAVAVAGMTRPEGPLLGIAMALVTVVHGLIRVRHAPRRARSRAWRGGLVAGGALALGFAALYAPFFLWRTATFGQLLPNTVVCKAAYAGDPWRLLRESAPILGVCLAVSTADLRRWHRPSHLVGLLTVLLYSLALYGASPTVGYLGRHFLTPFALVTIPAAAGVGRILTVVSRQPTASALAVALGLKTALAGTLVAAGARDLVQDHARRYADRERARVELAGWLNRRLPRGSTYVTGDVGVVGHHTPHLAILDAYCLNCPEMTSKPVAMDRPRFASMVLDRAPAAIVVASKRSSHLVLRSGIYRHIMDEPRFSPAYQHVETFGAAGDGFQYWVYLRRDLADHRVLDSTP